MQFCDQLVRSSRVKILPKRPRKKHMLEVEESSVRLYFTSTSRDRPSHEVHAKLFAWKILSVTFLPFTHTMYTLITYKNKGSYLERKSQIGFYNTTHPHFREKATHPLVRNHCSLFSFPLSLLYIKKRFVPKHNPHLFKVQKVF